jgi:poly(A) polymerase
VADLRRGLIRVIGAAGERFAEDPVRIWRVIRYAARLGFTIGEDVGNEIRRQRHLLGGCSDARLFEEFSKDLLGPQTRSVVDGLRKYGILNLLLGRIGETYESDPPLFAKACALLDIADREKELRRDPGLGEMSVLLFWPWVESLLALAPPDPGQVLKKAFMDAGLAVALPKSLRAQVSDVMVMVNRMMRGLRSGNMRWSMRGRPQYPEAARLCFLIGQNRVPEEGESFESLFQKAFPERPLRVNERRRRRRPRRKRPLAQ